MFNIKSFAVVSKNINKQITNWTSGGYSGWTDELKKQEYEKILKDLKNDFQYTENKVNNEMKMKRVFGLRIESSAYSLLVDFTSDDYFSRLILFRGKQ